MAAVRAAAAVTGSYNFGEVHVRPSVASAVTSGVTSGVALFYVVGYAGDLTENHAEAFTLLLSFFPSFISFF